MPAAYFPADLLSWRVNEMVFMTLTHRYFMVYIFMLSNCKQYLDIYVGNSLMNHRFSMDRYLDISDREWRWAKNGKKNYREHTKVREIVLKVRLRLKASFIDLQHKYEEKK